MAFHSWQSLATRFGAGHGVWALVAFLFPTLAIVKDDSVILAMLLFVLETMLAAGVLLVRAVAASRIGGFDDPARRRAVEARRVLQFFVAPFSLGCLVLFGAVAFIEFAKGRLPLDGVHLLGERASWMAGMLLASAVIDSVIAPVRSVHWIETAVAWQGSRTAVMTLVLMLGWPVMLFSGTSQGFFWIFFALRLLSDLGGLRPSERERIRARMFDRPARESTSDLSSTASAPPPFSRNHAKHDADDPQRLPR